MVIKLGKTKDSRTRKKKVTEDAELELLQRLQNEKDQPEFIKYLLQKGYSIKSSERYLKDIELYKKWLNKENIIEEAVSYNDITHYIQSKKGKVKQITIQTVLASLKQYYNYLQELGFVAENPTVNIQIKGIKRKVLHNILSKQELEKIYFDYKNLETCTERSRSSESLSKKRNEIIVSLLIYQGLTVKEIAELQLQSINLNTCEIHIKSGYRQQKRTLPLQAKQVLLFFNYLEKGRKKLLKYNLKKEEQTFILGQYGNEINPHSISRIINQNRKESEKIKPIKIRQSVIANLLKKENDTRLVQVFSGHKRASTTIAYKQTELEQLQNAIENYHPIS